MTSFYLLTAHTNLHVGSGDANYGVIDNLVQRDVLTELPTIHESGIKGALKEYFAYQYRGNHGNSVQTAKDNEPLIQHVFGYKDGDGKYRFYGGHLLTFPVRPSEGALFLRATSPQLLKDLIDYAKVFGVTLPDLTALTILSNLAPAINRPFVFNDKFNGKKIEYKNFVGLLNTSSPVSWLGGNTLVVFNDDDFKQICGPNKLPVLARNSLQDGQSKNLWYEEIVPRQTTFYSFVFKTDVLYDIAFEAALANGSIQVGGNASIGYGVMKFENKA